MSSLFSVLVFIGITTLARASKMKVVYEWKYFDYEWESPEAKIKAIASGDYDYTKAALIDVDTAPDGRNFVTVIRTQGVPATLSTVSKRMEPGGPLLKPYPNWSWHRKNDCNSITNVFRVAIDKCGRLWVLDTGVIDGDQVCEAQLLVFDLASDKILGRTKILNRHSQNPFTRKGLLITPIVQTDSSFCDIVKVFMADVQGNGMVVFDQNHVWRIDDFKFGPDWNPSAANVTIAGESFILEDGLFGMALTPKNPKYKQELFFRPFASRSMYAATVKDILATYPKKPLNYRRFDNVLPSQSTAQAFSSDGILFFGLTREIAIGCWNAKTKLQPENIGIAAQDDEKLQFASAVKVIPTSLNGKTEELWVATNRYQKIALGTMDFREINFRVLKQSVSVLVADTKCKT